MAQQAILAANRRNNNAKASAGTICGGGGGGGSRTLHVSMNLRTALKENSARLYQLFKLWDEDGNGTIDENELLRAVKMLGIKPAPTDFEALLQLCVGDKVTRGISLDDLTRMLEQDFRVMDEQDQPTEPPGPKPRCHRRILTGFIDLMNTTSMQTILYFTFVVCFQSLTETLRLPEEYLLDKMFADTFLENYFDPNSQEKFVDIRRTAEVWEWGNTVLWPGLLGNSGPDCEAPVGAGRHFNSSTFNTSIPAMAPADFKDGCNDDVWPDGDGVFSGEGGTAWTIEELVERMNQFDWTEGVLISTSRVQSRPASDCRGAATIGGRCYPELSPNNFQFEDTVPFGHNWTADGESLTNPFRYTSAAEAGTDPAGVVSANPASYRSYPPGGFLSIVLPFFSEVWLPDERGTHTEVTDYRLHHVTKYTVGRTPRFFCVRLVWNAEYISQLCDPNDGGPLNRTTGRVRAAVEEFWNDLKRAHFLDHQTRAMTITWVFSTNHASVRSQVTFMFEIASTGAVLTSYGLDARVDNPELLEATRTFVFISFCFTLFFCSLEVVEILSNGLMGYFSDLWNVMDWLNYILFFMAWLKTLTYLEQATDTTCASVLCQTIGYRDPWQVMATCRELKSTLSLCVCIQLLKIIKFASALVPKMDLAPSVLKKALPDLVFFGVVFIISMIAFSMMFYVQARSPPPPRTTALLPFPAFSMMLHIQLGPVMAPLPTSPSFHGRR